MTVLLSPQFGDPAPLGCADLDLLALLCPREIVSEFVRQATLEDAALLAFEINALAAESFVELWNLCRKAMERRETPTAFDVCQVQQAALRVRYARARCEGRIVLSARLRTAVMA